MEKFQAIVSRSLFLRIVLMVLSILAIAISIGEFFEQPEYPTLHRDTSAVLPATGYILIAGGTIKTIDLY